MTEKKALEKGAARGSADAPPAPTQWFCASAKLRSTSSAITRAGPEIQSGTEEAANSAGPVWMYLLADLVEAHRPCRKISSMPVPTKLSRKP